MPKVEIGETGGRGFRYKVKSEDGGTYWLGSAISASSMTMPPTVKTGGLLGLNSLSPQIRWNILLCTR